MITKNDRPARREAEWSHQRWVTWLLPCSLYLLRKTLVQWYAKAGGWGDLWGFGWRCEGSSRPECSLSRWVSRLTWSVRPSTDWAFIPPSLAASAPNKATIWSPWISKSFSFWFPLNSACVFPLCSEQRVRFPLLVMKCLVNCVCNCVYVFGSLSTRGMTHWWDHLKQVMTVKILH